MSTINGDALANILNGTALDDFIYGFGGNDTLKGLGGSDRLNGGAGADRMFGGAGNDFYTVDNVNDQVFETSTNTSTVDNGGIDTVLSSVTYSIEGSINGRQFIEKIKLTGAANINATGNSLNNTLTGNNGNNTLSGLDGNDKVVAGGGADTIIGGKGRDTMSGGLGNDVFKFASALDTWAWSDFSGASHTSSEVITDFNTGDKIDLSGVDAISSPSGHNVTGDQSFVFIGTNSFHSHTAREIRYEIYNGDTYIYGSINGDTSADFGIKLVGSHTLSSSDFIL
jgi:Ca2+-binding RTX toxin-like protein